MKRILLFLLAVSPYVFAQTQASGPVRIAGWGRMDAAPPVQGAPFSATITNKTTQTLADGNRMVQTSTYTVSRDSQGRTRQELPLPPIGKSSETPRLVMINDPIAHKVYTLDLTNKTVHELELPSSEPASGPDHSSHSEGFSVQVGPGELAGGPMLSIATIDAKQANGQVKTEDLGSQTMEGLLVNGVRTTRTIPAGQVGNSEPITIVTEVWTSPDLKTAVYSKRVDPLMGEQTSQLSDIVRAEPDPSLFTVPADFTIVDGPKGHASQ